MLPGDETELAKSESTEPSMRSINIRSNADTWAEIPTGKLGNPQEVAETVLWMSVPLPFLLARASTKSHASARFRLNHFPIGVTDS